MSKTTRSLLATGGFLLVVASVVFAVNRERWFYYRFTPELWKKTSEGSDHGRHYYQARYLVDHSLLLGLSQNEIVSRLGAPDSKYDPAAGSAHYIYYLGKERDKHSLKALNVAWMEITFTAGKVTAVQIK